MDRHRKKRTHHRNQVGDKTICLLEQCKIKEYVLYTHAIRK